MQTTQKPGGIQRQWQLILPGLIIFLEKSRTKLLDNNSLMCYRNKAYPKKIQKRPKPRETPVKAFREVSEWVVKPLFD